MLVTMRFSSLIRTAMHCCDILFISDNLSMDFFIRVINGVVVYTTIIGKISCQHFFEEEKSRRTISSAHRLFIEHEGERPTNNIRIAVSSPFLKLSESCIFCSANTAGDELDGFWGYTDAANQSWQTRERKMAVIFEEATINGMTMRNRLIRSATWEGMCEGDGRPGDKLINLYRDLARWPGRSSGSPV